MAWLSSSVFARKRDVPPPSDPGAHAQALLERLLEAQKAIARGAYFDARCCLSEAENGVLRLQQDFLTLLRRNESLAQRLEDLTSHRRTA